MSINLTYTCTCHACNAAKSGTATEMEEAGWRKVLQSGVVLDPSQWATEYGDDCVCNECYDKYVALQKAADEAQQAAYDAIGKFTPTPSPSGGSGTVDDPYTFEAGVVCVLNAYYRHGEHVYVYMPADAEAKSYDSWEAAEADFAIWDEDTTETSETA